ncbi:unnamed protein product [Ectocarpus sp. 12 AP-2014]
MKHAFDADEIAVSSLRHMRKLLRILCSSFHFALQHGGGTAIAYQSTVDFNPPLQKVLNGDSLLPDARGVGAQNSRSNENLCGDCTLHTTRGRLMSVAPEHKKPKCDSKRFSDPAGVWENDKRKRNDEKTVAPRSMCQLKPSAAKFLPPVVATGPDRIFRGCGKGRLLYQPTEPFFIHRTSEDP